MIPDEAEIKLLSSITTPKDITFLIREGVDERSFLVYGSVWEHFLSYSRQYGTLPKHRDMESEFRVTFVDSGELEYYMHEVLHLSMIRKAEAVVLERFGDNGNKLKSDPEEVVRLVVEDLRKLRRPSVQHVAWLDKDALIRLGWLKERAIASEEERVLGIRTGLKCFDSRLQGWSPGEAIMVIAPKGVGKSWFASYIATVAYRDGYKVLFLSPEMSWRECSLRFDVLIAYQMGVNLSHQALATGKQDQQVYEDFLRQLSRRDQLVVVDSPENTGFNSYNVIALVEEHRPDLVVLDGIHLIGGEPNQTGWERIKQAADSLKAAAQHLNCVVVWTSQVDREAMRNPTEPASTGASAAYGKAAVEAANRLITLANADNSRRKTFKVPNNRGGAEFHTKLHLAFDVDIGHVEQIELYSPIQNGEEVF